MEKEISFNDPCPFLSCTETGSHSHPICPECGAVRYGNLTCKECRKYMAEKYPTMIQAIEKALKGAGN